MFHGVVMDVIEMRLHIEIVPDGVLPEPILPNNYAGMFEVFAHPCCDGSFNFFDDC